MRRIDKLERLRDALDVVYETVADLIPEDAMMKLAPVTYFYPTAARVANEWTKVRASAQIAIANPSSGAGTSANADYAAEITRCVAAGLTVLGYNNCKWLQRPLADVIAETHRLWQHYPSLQGIFMDQVSTDDTQDNRGYLEDVKDAVRAHGGVLYLNPGTDCPEWFMEIADIVMISETTAAQYMTRDMPGWVDEYHPSRFYHCVHDCPAGDMQTVIDQMRENNAGYVYVTDQPYSELPSYWPALVDAVKLA